MNIYVTGGTGFIGSYVVNALAKGRHTINILARNPQKVPAIKHLKNVFVHKAPVDDLAALKKTIKKPDALIHIALCWGNTGPDMIKNETLKSVELIDLAVKKGAKKIIFTSSTAAVGYSQKNTDETSQRRPTDFYGATKGAVELYLNAYANYNPKIKFNVIRPGYTFGNPVFAGSDTQPDTRFKDICRNAKLNKKIEVIENDGTQFIWAGDLAHIYKKVIDRNIKDEIFFGLSKNYTTWKQIARWAIKYSGSKSKIKSINKGYSSNPPLFAMKSIDRHFGLSFNSTERLKEHVKYMLEQV